MVMTMKTLATNTRLWERKCDERNERMNITYINKWVRINYIYKSVSDQDTDKEDNNSDVNESQSIDINSINLNNHTSNDCESPSDSDNIATRVKAKYSKARQKKIHKKSQKLNTRRRNNIYNQTRKKRKTQTRNLDILSPYIYIL